MKDIEEQTVPSYPIAPGTAYIQEEKGRQYLRAFATMLGEVFVEEKDGRWKNG